MRPPAAGTNLAYVEMMATTFGTKTDPVEKARFEIVAPRESAQVPFNVIAERSIGVAVLGVRLSARRNPASGYSDLPQEIDTALLGGCAPIVSHPV
jgi:hypothetical protein